MRESIRKLLFLLMVLAFAASASASASAGAADDTDDLPHRLNQGYSLLYGEVSDIANADRIFLVKFESDATERVVTALTRYLSGLSRRLERMAADDSALRIDLDPLPLMERRKKEAASAARLENLAPITGRTGPAFERTLLLYLSGGSNRMLHLARVMADIEDHPQRRRFLQQVDQRLTALRADIQQLLQRRYYTQPSGAKDNP